MELVDIILMKGYIREIIFKEIFDTYYFYWLISILKKLASKLRIIS